MNNAEIQIQFPTPGEWGEFILTAIYKDADGYTRTDHYTQDDIPADQAPAMQAVVAALVGLSEPWQASQGWARLAQVRGTNPEDIIPAIILDVEAINAQGGRRMFTSADYPAFIIPSPSAVAFFQHFTKS